MKKLFTTLFALMLTFSLCLFATSCLVADNEGENGPSSVEVASVQEFLDSIKDGAEISLVADLEFAELSIPEDTKFTVDLGGHTLSLGLKEEGRHHYLDNYGDLTLKGKGTINARGVQNFGKLTIENGLTINSVDQNGGAAVWNEGELIINGGTFRAPHVGSSSNVSGPGCLNNNGGNATINGGTFVSNNNRTYSVISSGNTVINDAIVIGVHGALSVEGGHTSILAGTFNASNYYALYVAGEGEAQVLGGYLGGGLKDVRVESDSYAFIGRNVSLGKGSIYGNVVTEVLVSNVEEFTNAIADKNCIVLNADLEVAQVTVPENVTLIIDLNKHTITTTLQTEGRHYYVDNYGTLTLKGEGVINARGVQNFGKLTIEDGLTINSVDQNGGAAVWNEGDLIVNGGVFHAEYVGSSSDVSGPGCINNKANAVINGGLFTSNNLRTYAVISSGNIEINNATVEGAHGALAVEGGLATINGGTFCADVHYGLYAFNSTVTVNGGTFTGGSTGVDVYSDADASVTIGENAVLTNNKTNGSGSVIFEENQ